MQWIHHLDDLAPWRGDPICWVVAPDVAPTHVSPDDADDIVLLGPDHGARRLKNRHLLRRLAARALNTHIDHVRLARQASGGIRITAPEELWASCASSGQWTIAAIGRQPIGVDIESRPMNHPPPLALLHAEEQQSLQSTTPAMCESLFLRLWTAREAYLKALGCGIDAPLSRFRASAGPGTAVEMMAADKTVAVAETLEAPNYVAAALGLKA